MTSPFFLLLQENQKSLKVSRCSQVLVPQNNLVHRHRYSNDQNNKNTKKLFKITAKDNENGSEMDNPMYFNTILQQCSILMQFVSVISCNP